MEILRDIGVIYYLYFRPILDVALLAFLLYESYLILMKTQAIPLIKGSLSVLIIYAVAFILNLSSLLWLLNKIAPGLFIAIAIVFQPELRKMFLKIGQGNWFKLGKKSSHDHIDSILTAAELLSEKKRGMLVVFIRNNNLKDIIDTGVRLNADLSSSLLVTIFGHDTPLHDGATIVEKGKIISSGCFLPLSDQQDIRKSFGTRHRAAIGVTEQSDAVVLIVSEETGALSLAHDSKLYYDLSRDEIIRQLAIVLDIKSILSEPKDESLSKQEKHFGKL